MDTSPLAAFCFSGNSNPCRRITSISGNNKIDTFNSVISEKNHSDKNDKFNLINLKRPPKNDNNSVCFDTGSFKMSPTTSLVAELSGNFYIDKSPVPPTPRRSLLFKFSCDYQSTPVLNFLKDPVTPKFDSLTMDNTNIVTPCFSSPVEAMDYSPLPHKQTLTTFDVEQSETFGDQNSCLYVNSKVRDSSDMKYSRTFLNDMSDSNELDKNILDKPMANENLKTKLSTFNTIYNKDNVDNSQIKDNGESCDITLNDLFTDSPDPVRFSTKNVAESDLSQSSTKPLFSRYSVALETSPFSFMDNDDVDYLSVKWRRTQSLYQDSSDFF